MDRPKTHKKDFLYFLVDSFSLSLDNVHTNIPCTLKFRDLIRGVGGGRGGLVILTGFEASKWDHIFVKLDFPTLLQLCRILSAQSCFVFL